MKIVQRVRISVLDMRSSSGSLKSPKMSFRERSRWKDYSSVAYLNLIESRHIGSAFDYVPWSHHPIREDLALRLCADKILQNYESHRNVTNTEDLEKLIRVYHRFQLFPNHIDIPRYDRLIKLFADIEYSNRSVVVELWSRLGRREHIFDSLVGHHRARATLDYMLRVAQRARFDFWGLRTGDVKDGFRYCPVTDCLMKGDYWSLKKLLQYGFEVNSQRYIVYLNYFNLKDLAVLWKETEPTCRLRTVIDTTMFLSRYRKSSRKVRCQMQACNTLLWKSTAIPYVTKTELQNDYYQLLVAHLFRTNYQKLNVMLDTLWDEVLYCDASLEPRSLEQLCMCSIRKALRCTWNMPGGIQKLGLPKSLVSSLMFEWDGNEPV